MVSDDFIKNVERLEKAIADSRAAARECNEATASLKATIKEAKEADKWIKEFIDGEFQNYVAFMIKENFSGIPDKVHELYDSILRNFDTLAAPLMEAITAMEIRMTQLETRANRLN